MGRRTTTSDDNARRRSWLKKFADAFRGLVVGIQGQSSFAVHLPCAVLVIGLVTCVAGNRLVAKVGKRNSPEQGIA